MKDSSADMRSRILAHLAGRSYQPQQARPLARSMGIEESEYAPFRTAVKELMRAGRVVQGGGECIMLPEGRGELVGTFRGHAKGFGFVVPDSPTEHGDLFIPPGANRGALTGDKVAARLTRRGQRAGGNRVEGEVVEIFERGHTQFVGELVRDGDRWLVRPDGNVLHVPIIIADATASNAKVGDQVVVELTEYPTGQQPARGVITKVLGGRGDPGVDTLSIMHQYHLPEDFPAEVAASARAAIQSYAPEDAARSRQDLRDLVIVTIDPDDARDFDDAISVSELGNGVVELGVHIADVSAFVRPGTPLDAEAALRGNSVYLPGRVIPMLPEVLSNGVCSLQEGQPRLTKSAFIRYDRQGRRAGARFAETIIHSARRLTYRQAAEILAGNTGRESPAVVALLRSMDQLARRIQKRRLADGMLVLDLPDVDVVLDDDGQVTRVEPADTSFPHTIIEMFMVEANDAVGELMRRLGVPHLRRIHPPPPPDAAAKLNRFLQMLGKAAPREVNREAIVRILASVRGKPESFAVNLGVLRSMGKAEYSPRMEGHFALASEDYCHFTSPIRRYPDLAVHRLLAMHLAGKLRHGRQLAADVPSRERLTEMGKWCSYTEGRAETAERELRHVKILRFLEGKLGETEAGVVTGVANVGVFVQLRQYLIDGLIRVADLPDDWWNVNPERGCVEGQHSGRRIAIGDLLQVKIARIDLSRRELDLVLAETQKPTSRSRRNRHSSPPAAKNAAVSTRGATTRRPRSRRDGARALGSRRKRRRT